ncbi:aldehyde dehydrogenase family protein [Ectothiorhodospiraceae bacterium BW-2]|nr:aldehyde dehydrogenase family protein [Ectothiorhodospiraceae bacterium BW-2]
METAVNIQLIDSIENRPYINGQYCSLSDSLLLSKKSPLRQLQLKPLFDCTACEVDEAVNAANASYLSRVWCDKPVRERKQIIFAWADIIEANLTYLAQLDTLETGRAYRNFIEDSIPKAISVVRWFAEAVDKVHDESYQPNSQELALVAREPLGVVAAILPWNDPLVVAAWKIAPALLMGNSVVIKPAEEASYSILAIAAMATSAGLPDGVLNVVTGRGEVTGEALARHPKVRGLFFTGSSAVGKKMLFYAGESNMKKIGLECGGKSPFILTRNYANLPHAAEVLAKNIFYNQGQICSSPSRLIIDKEIKKSFLSLLYRAAKIYVPADPFNPQTTVGSIVSQEQYQRIQGFIQRAKQAGIEPVVIEGDAAIPTNGYYIAPTIFDEVTPDSELAQQEIFGPVLIIHSYEHIEEALHLANNTHYGLAASVWTNDINEAFFCSRRLEAGMVHVNSYGDDDNAVPFGGVKESGIGKDKSLHALNEYCELKTTWIKLN